jgi:hypothetical protein
MTNVPCDQVDCHFSLFCALGTRGEWLQDLLVTCCPVCKEILLLHNYSAARTDVVALLPREMAVKCDRSQLIPRAVCSHCNNDHPGKVIHG